MLTTCTNKAVARCPDAVELFTGHAQKTAGVLGCSSFAGIFNTVARVVHNQHMLEHLF